MDLLNSALENNRDGQKGSPRLSSKACPHCERAVALDSPHVRIARGGISVYCSEACLRDVMSPSDRRPSEMLELEQAPVMPGMSRVRSIFIVGLGIASFSPCATYKNNTEALAPVVVINDDSAQESALDYGPHLPTEEELADEFAASLGKHGWVHPLPGPTRHMPTRQSRAFGADRPGNRPFECRSGHCGVDLGGLWGERILASSDAVVDKVNRDPNRSGGLYVKLSHLDGTVFTQYFHLAAIPRQLREGNSVRAGTTIGLLGETGVENSGPHLHFTVSVKSSADAPEIHIDPEPLIALWPIRQLDSGHQQEVAGPGVPIGATGRYKHKRQGKQPAKARAPELSSDDKTEPAKAEPGKTESVDLRAPQEFGFQRQQRANTPPGPDVSAPN